MRFYILHALDMKTGATGSFTVFYILHVHAGSESGATGSFRGFHIHHAQPSLLSAQRLAFDVLV